MCELSIKVPLYGSVYMGLRFPFCAYTFLHPLLNSFLFFSDYFPNLLGLLKFHSFPPAYSFPPDLSSREIINENIEQK